MATQAQAKGPVPATANPQTGSLSRLEATRSMSKLIAVSIEDVINEYMERNRLRKQDEITELYVGEMGLESVPDLDKLSQLQVLWLNRNKLRTLEFLRRNVRLKELYLQHNRIGSIATAFRNMRHLQTLLLQDNQLRGLKEVVAELKPLCELEILNLFGNPAAQEINYRLYVVHHIPSLKILDRKEITEAERNKARAMFEPVREGIRQSIAFGRRSVGSPSPTPQSQSKSRTRTKFSSMHDEERVDSGHVRSKHSSRGNSAKDLFKSKFAISRAEYLDALTTGNPKTLENLISGRLLDEKDRARIATMAEEVQTAVTARIRRHSVMEFHTFDWFEVNEKALPAEAAARAVSVPLPSIQQPQSQQQADGQQPDSPVRARRGSMVSIRLK